MTTAKVFEFNDESVKKQLYLHFIDYIQIIGKNKEFGNDFDEDLFKDLLKYKETEGMTVGEDMLYKYGIFYNSISNKSINKLFNLVSLVKDTDYESELIYQNGVPKYYKYKITGDAFERCLAHCYPKILKYYKLINDCTMVYYKDYQEKFIKKFLELAKEKEAETK